MFMTRDIKEKETYLSYQSWGEDQLQKMPQNSLGPYNGQEHHLKACW